MNPQLWWYVARSGGIVAWALLAASVLWGLALSTKVLRGRPRPNWILDLHRFLGGLALVFTGIHVGSLILDSYVHFGLVEVLVPFTGAWHPVAVAWGVISLYLLIAVELTSLARKRISKRTWRLTHYLSFPLFLLTTVHALSAGTDRSTLLLRWSVILVSVLITALTFVRLNKSDRHDLLTAPRSTTAARTQAARIAAEKSAGQRSVLSGSSQGRGG
jgi:DMSO/TMAO reductase YedYZ heme-binding membrane subunit